MEVKPSGIKMRPFNAYLFLLIFSISFSNCFTLPTSSPGVGFGNGAIDLGGLLVYQMKNLTEPLPDGFFVLGSYSQSHNNSPSGWYLAGKDTTNDPSRVILKSPIDYTIVKNVTSQAIKKYGGAYVWRPIPPKGYMALGNVATGSSDKPPLDKIRCVLSDFVEIQEYSDYIWGAGNATTSDSFNLHSSLREEVDGNYSSLSNMTTLDVPTGTSNSNTTSSVTYLKNVDGNYSSMPNMTQIDELIKKYSPVIYFHPDEQFFPSLVSYFFENGGLLYTKGNESNPVLIDPTGSNLPQGGSDDGLYWLDLPIDNAARGKVQFGDLGGAGAYIHVKPALGATCTDIAIWIFYPFNGPARAKINFFNVNLGKVGEHVGDWEHVTLRISNFHGELQSVYFAQHGKGIWVDAPGIEYQSGTKPVVYSSLHGHAAYPKPGTNLLGDGNVGVRNDAAKGDRFMDTGMNYKIISADYLNPPIAEPSWLNYARKWGPTINSDFSNDLGKATKILPGNLKKKFMNLFNNLPKELLAEEGPTGPKWKASWVGDENA